MRNAICLLWLVVASCSKPNPNLCCVDEADCTANHIPVGSTCADGLLCRGNQCVAETCSTADQCDQSAPYCVSSTCAASCTDDSQCPGAGQDASDKFCVGGACAVCRVGMNDCPASDPVCDANSCRGCKVDSECPSKICSETTGTCLDSAGILYASTTGSDLAPCTLESPCSLVQAINVAIADQTRNTIQLAPGTYGSLAQTTLPLLTGARAISMYGPGATLLTMFWPIEDGAVLHLHELTTDDTEFQCRESTSTSPAPALDVDRVQGQDVQAILFSVNDCNLTVTRSSFEVDPTTTTATFVYSSGVTIHSVTVDRSSFTGGGSAIALNGTTSLKVTNSVFIAQGAAGAVGMGSTSAGTVEFSTFYNSRLLCPDGSTIITAANNIFVNASAGAPADTVTGTACSHSYEIISPQSTNPGGTGNQLNVDPMFVNAASGDFHLTAHSSAIDAADPAGSDTDDFDGTPRPQGAHLDIGAFEYKP